MVTYPSTHGVFEGSIREICRIVHEHGGQVYMDGANMNAQVGLCRPGDIGADVCHLNLHKTFCIPHGGGGPGHGTDRRGQAPGAVPARPPDRGPRSRAGLRDLSAAPWGSAAILPISWAYIALMGYDGLTEATKIAILNANYVARRLEPTLQRALHRAARAGGARVHPRHPAVQGLGRVSTSRTSPSGSSTTASIRRRSRFRWPGTLMIEPTESESKEELDRFCDAMIAIREEIREIEEGRADREHNLLTNAPHTLEQVIADGWNRPYPRERAAYPSRAMREHKVWPTVGRIDSAFGDRNLVCVCPPMEAYE